MTPDEAMAALRAYLAWVDEGNGTDDDRERVVEYRAAFRELVSVGQRSRYRIDLDLSAATDALGRLADQIRAERPDDEGEALDDDS
jgi:hypothetical protein